jgi:hypothetical protein
VAARRRSWRRASEHGKLERAGAPEEDEDTIPVLELAEEAVEVGRRR